MTRLHVLATVLLLACLAALPATAQTIPAGDDLWVTPADGQTVITLAPNEVENLCGATPSSSWDHRLFLKGVPVTGADWDTRVRRLDSTTFDASGNASTRIIVTRLEFASIAPQSTPCGPLTWRVTLATPQAITKMKLRKTSGKGGFFSADIAVNAELRATNASGAYIGSLFYNLVLPDPSGGTPWSFGPTGQFRPGITATDDCIAILREELNTLPAWHFYFLSNLIAQGLCYRQ